MCPFHTKKNQKHTHSSEQTYTAIYLLFVNVLSRFNSASGYFHQFHFLTVTWHIGHLYIKVVLTVWICICCKVKNCFCGMFRLWDFFILICSFGMSWFAYIFFFYLTRLIVSAMTYVLLSFFHINHFFHKYTLIIRSVSSSKNNVYNGEKLAIFKSIHAIPLK